MAEILLILFLGLAALVLLAYVVHPDFRAQVDADTARRRQRRRPSTETGAGRDPLADAELWPDPPADPGAFDRWFSAHGTGQDPRPPADSRD